jgi:hypothetical protein
MSHCPAQPSSLAHLHISFLMGRQTVHVYMCSTRPFIILRQNLAGAAMSCPSIYCPLPIIDVQCVHYVSLCITYKMFYDRKETSSRSWWRHLQLPPRLLVLSSFFFFSDSIQSTWNSLMCNTCATGWPCLTCSTAKGSRLYTHAKVPPSTFLFYLFLF